MLKDTLGKIWPNGEFSIWRVKLCRPVETKQKHTDDFPGMGECLLRSLGFEEAVDAVAALGLSKDSNLDKRSAAAPPKKRYGLKGLSSKASRRLRNGAFVLQRERGRKTLSFATVTLPSDLTESQENAIHLNWGKVMNFYQREVKRELQRGGLPGEMVGCAEIQPGRFAETGKPWLHAHYVFQGKKRSGKWALTTQKHDEIWWRALNSVVVVPFASCASCCNLQVVRKDASQYLSKYMSKGSAEINEAIENGYEHWLPKQWYFMTQSLLTIVQKATKYGSDIAFMLECERYDHPEYFKYWKDIFVEIEEGCEYGVWVGASGCLSSMASLKFQVMLS